MAKCSCSGQTCGCRLVAGENITVTGAGTARDPWVIAGEAGGGGGTGWNSGDRKETYRTDTSAGWLECNGQAVSRATYASLFTAIGTRFGSGDGVNTFNLPNETGRVALGAGPGYPQDQTGGSASTTLSVQNLPPHTHTINHDHPSATTSSAGAHTHNLTKANNDTNGPVIARGTGAGVTNDSGVASAGAHTHTFNVPTFSGNSGSTGNGAAFTNLPPYRAMRVLIKT